MSFFAHRRSGRGYAFETGIVKYFEERLDPYLDWHARRLGGTSVGLPDVVVTNGLKSILFAIEAKSTFQHAAYIKNDQIIRCIKTLDVFNAYKKRYVVFAFKFSKNPTKGNDKLRYYFFKVLEFANVNNIEWVKCFYDGRIRYKVFNSEIKSEIKLIKYNSLSDLKDNVIVKTLMDD